MTTASYFSTEMTQITGNAGGAVQSLPAVTLVGARERVFVAHITLASQTSGSFIGIARLPVGAMITGVTYITDTSLGSSTIALGDVNTAALYAAAQTLTTTQTPTRVGLAATHGQPITTGYDCTTGAVSKANIEDVGLTIAVANFPASGNLVVIIEYAHD